MKTKNIMMIILLVTMIPVAGLAMGQLHKTQQTQGTQKHQDLYYCPMHPQIFYNHPGNCPICGMKLIKKGTEAVQQRSGCSCCGMKRS